MIFDIVVIVVLFISGIIAFMRGFIREVLTIAGVAGGLAAAYFAGPILIPYMEGWLGVYPPEGSPEALLETKKLFGILPYDVLAMILSYGLIFIIVVILLSIVSHMLAEAARSLGLGAVDRSLGFIFGLVRGILLLGLLYLPVHLFADSGAKDAWFGESRTHFYVEKTAMAMASFLPDDAGEQAGKFAEDAEKAVTTRDRLKVIDLLPQDPKDKETDDGEEGAGYTEEFRDELDGLFEEKSRSLNE